MSSLPRATVSPQSWRIHSLLLSKILQPHMTISLVRDTRRPTSPFLETVLHNRFAALVLTYLISQSDRTLPNGIITIAPAAIQVYTNLSEHARAQANVDIFPLSLYQFASTMYMRDSGLSPEDGLISGAYIPFTNSWPKTLIMVGTGDQLIDASRELEKNLKGLETPMELVEYDGVPHGWWVFPRIFPEENQDAARRIARFILGS
ncbi:hypothetical protein PAXRUDRAFT_829115 [Paxillus rubicundulus Ve08.2h10]|uniref:Alpha/beta hydrolase fold-3 domain-containing protein n=1 Tax=Paxillus rubicundulus Ve08.2h10 TaxID=930991 RepID=A0A0D0E6E1_9AGAM|nr:hypothetical protein PAXRUDRAFT_829115 [Paxillus rubicundulus Ve08.2h10]